MRTVVILGLLIGCSLGLRAQGTYVLKGRLLDSTNRSPLTYSNVNIVLKDSTLQNLQTDSTGNFSFNGLSNSVLELRLLPFGYLSKRVPLRWLGGKILDLGTLLFVPDVRQLKDVKIIASKPLVHQEIDRLSYDVQADPESKVLSVMDIIVKVPMLSVDGDENIKLKGSGNYKIFINGRPSSILARNPKEALKAMPAVSVLRIEVITTPPSKYDAEGLSGIINIVLNKRLVDGYNASLGANYNNTLGLGENASLTGKKGKIGITGTAYVYQDFKQTLETENTRNTLSPYLSILSQNGNYSYVGNYHTESVELSFEADTLNLITGSVNFFKSRYDNQDNLSSTLWNSGNQIVQAYQSVNINPQTESGLDLNFNYQLGFAHRKDRLLTFSYQYQHAPSNQNNTVLLSQQFNYPLSSYLQANKNATREQTIQVDYIQPAKTFTFDGGVKAILRRSFSDYTSDLYPSDQFNYHQNIYSLYHSWYVKLKFAEFKAGLRLEHTDINANFTTQANSLSTGYTNLIPVISVQHKFSASSLNLSFTQRISRPGILQLNPYIDRSNPLFISTGNPGLKAVLNNNFEIAYNAYGKGNYNIALSYSFADNDIQQVTSIIDTLSFTTYQNIGHNKTIGLNASVSYPITSTFSASLNSAVSYLWIDGIFSGKPYANKGLQGYAYASFNYKVAKTWRASASVTVYSANITLQGSTNPYIFNSYRITKSLLDDKFSLSAGISNPFGKYRYTRVHTQTADFDQMVVSQRFYRTFGLSASYKFGSLKSDLKKNQRSISNDDVLKK
ncbi:outer membrane beta-barrel family protein [Pedobacter mendelii]|uniref:TonB-dependent receptor n=1 Tax=Pedobacter mendelii TaxID=1908240 RepID=A0ABQ2BG26_9SPHI|nr:outer membrane beta-barrel family protein [Pedobacter mendelii]GGI23313.1 TonB-dependent receptor [Pedobacter mendelii]